MNVSATSTLAITAGMALTSHTGDADARAIATLAVLTGLVMLAAGLLKRGMRQSLVKHPEETVLVG